MDVALLVAEALEFIFPAYVANAVPVLAGGGRPMDFGKNFFDGKPIFGKNKTFRGFFFGLVLGTVTGFAESLVFGYPLFFGFVLSLGALFGDLGGAFVKRRLGLASGQLLPVVDQVDFVVGAVLFVLPFSLQWLSWQLVLTVLVITPPMHLLTNFAAYKLGLKSNPW
jgi:CDP-2,3-bis-(O-geranylgeranyl)-sn-glycerol synthase